MTPKQRVLEAMAGRRPSEPAVSVYISWPEYGWRLSGHKAWEVVLGAVDGLAVTDRALRRHRSDFVGGPIGQMGTGWACDKEILAETDEATTFRCPKTGRTWRFSHDSHCLIEVDAAGQALADTPEHATPADDPPRTIPEAEDWFRRRYADAPRTPSHAPADDAVIQRWGQTHYTAVCTLSPYIAVIYALGFEPGLMLLASEPRVFARLEELYLEFYEPHYAWAAQAGYDGGHMVDSYASADIISPATYRDWVAPIYRQSVAMIHRQGLLADLYTPGQVMPMLEHLAGQGWDALRIEDACKGQEQDIGLARKALGPEQCLFGNLSAYALLAGDWEDIQRRARYQHEAAGQSGPFIISNGSGLPDRTDPDIVDRWIEFACELAS